LSKSKKNFIFSKKSPSQGSLKEILQKSAKLAEKKYLRPEIAPFFVLINSNREITNYIKREDYSSQAVHLKFCGL